MIKTQGIGDLYELYELTRRNHIDYKLAYIPSDFHIQSSEGFDPEYMTALYDEGFKVGQSRAWKKKPPLLD